MADVIHERETGPAVVVKKGNAVAWLALLLSLLALTLGWLAYNRTGQDLEDKIRQQVEESTTITTSP